MATDMNGEHQARKEVSEKILGIIPAYNEAETISDVLIRAIKHIPVLVIDDGSKDGTAQAAIQCRADVYRQTPNQGKGAALKTGFKIALEEGYQAVITLDADGQHDPDEIPSFLEAYLLTGADLIIGERDFSHIPLVRRVANTLGMLSFSWALGQQIQDNQSGYRLLSRRMMQAVSQSQEYGFEFEVEMIVTCIQSGFQLEWIPIRTIYSGEASHINPLKHTIKFTKMVLQTKRKMRKSHS